MRQGSPSECSLGSTPRLVQVESFLIFVLKSNTQKVAPPVPGVLWQGFAKTLRICGFSIRHFPIGSICQIPRFTSCVVCNETVGVDPTSATPMFPSGRLWDGQPTLDVIPIWADRLLGADSNRKRCRRHTHTTHLMEVRVTNSRVSRTMHTSPWRHQQNQLFSLARKHTVD